MTVIQHGKIDFTVMYVTHDAFRRDLDRLGAAAADRRTGSRGVRAGWENFKNQLDVHHSVEDAALWPRVERAVAGRPADRELLAEMKAEHAQLHPPLAAVDQAMRHGAGDLTPLVRELSAVLGQHMRHEENSALPLIQEVLTPGDWSAFRRAMARRQGPRGAAMYVPWATEGLGDEERRRFLRMIGPPVPVINRLFWQPRYDKRDLWGN
jgi:iron-sulfur cluster repair protein YtfE (RIC family)